MIRARHASRERTCGATLVSVKRKTVLATYQLSSVEDGRALTYFVEVPSIDRGSFVPALSNGALDQESAVEAVRDLAVTWIGGERDSFDVELKPLFKPTPRE
jgi:hypothetical protein